MKTHVVICMGSSCFARGNNANLPAVQKWLEANPAGAEIECKGCRCGGLCGLGPNIWIDGRLYSAVTPEEIPALFARHLETRQAP